MSDLTDKEKLALMDKAVHALWRENPIAHELKRATHKHGGESHDLTLSTAFTAMHHLLGVYAKMYQEMIDAKESTEVTTPKIVAEKPTQEGGKVDGTN